MPLQGSAILCVWNDADPALEDEFNEWYLRQHALERVGIPGINRARRYRAAGDGAPRYAAFYEADTLDVLRSETYVRLLDEPTPWTRRMMPAFRNMQRGICSVAASLGEGIGGAASFWHLSPTPGEEARLRAWLCETVLPPIMRLPGIVAAHVWEGVAAASARPTTEVALRGGADRGVELVLVVEAQEQGALDRLRPPFRAHEPAEQGAAHVDTYPDYSLLVAFGG